MSLFFKSRLLEAHIKSRTLFRPALCHFNLRYFRYWEFCDFQFSKFKITSKEIEIFIIAIFLKSFTKIISKLFAERTALLGKISSFFAKIFLPKKSQSQNVSREKLHKALLYKKCSRKMLIKSTSARAALKMLVKLTNKFVCLFFF